MADDSGPVAELMRRAMLPAVIGADIWNAVRTAYPGAAFDRWADGLERVIAQDIGSDAVVDYARNSIAAAHSVGPHAMLATIPTCLMIGRKAGPGAAAAVLRAMGSAAMLLSSPESYRIWLQTIERLAGAAPESVEAVCARTAQLLGRLDADGFRDWVASGLRSQGHDLAGRQAYFAATDETALHGFQRGRSDIHFADVERRLKAFLMALWRLSPTLRTVSSRPGGLTVVRSSFDEKIIRVPSAYPGYHGEEAVSHFRAALAHAGAHKVFGGARFPTGSLKPVQIALVSLIEDARVEALAARDHPGLARLWGRFHVAEPDGGLTADVLTRRLARALADPSFQDPDPWVGKGRSMFFDLRNRWEDPALSRSIGTLLGNDLGQMRIQFNTKTYVVQPSYRDDNAGLWEHDEPPPEQAEAAETIVDSVRIETREEPDARRKDEADRNGSPANRAALASRASGDQGVPVARYAEWNWASAVEMRDWTTLVEFEPRRSSQGAARGLTELHRTTVDRISRLVRRARVSQPVRMRRQLLGDRLDLDAAIEGRIDRRMGLDPDPRVFETRLMRSRDMSVVALLDISESTRDRIPDTTRTVIGVAREAVAVLSEALAGLGDSFAVRAFCSNGREEVRYYRVKDFDQDYDDGARRRLAGLQGGLSTRLGAALRHAGQELGARRSHRRLLLVLSDGEPSDVDVRDPRYFVEDARRAVQDLAHRGIDVFCVGFGNSGERYLARIFGRRSFTVISRVEDLPEKLSMLYFRLTI